MSAASGAGGTASEEKARICQVEPASAASGAGGTVSEEEALRIGEGPDVTTDICDVPKGLFVPLPLKVPEEKEALSTAIIIYLLTLT